MSRLSVRLSVRTKQLDGVSFTLTLQVFFRKPVEKKIRVQLKSDKTTATLHADIVRVMIVSHSILVKIRSLTEK